MIARTRITHLSRLASRLAVPVAIALGVWAGIGSSMGCTGNIGDSDGVEGPGGGDRTQPLARDPGRVTLHRLNRVEYDNTVRDLLGTSLKPALEFPTDDYGYGYDNIADVLSVSPLQFELWDRAAEKLVDDALARPSTAKVLLPCTASTAPDATACVRQVVSGFATRAWRRPLSAEETDRLVALVDKAKALGGTVDDGIKNALRAVLESPHFLFRVELDVEPAGNKPHALSDWELASRLSYFLWSSMPDDALFSAAKDGTLHDPATLTAQTVRMLADPKAVALVDNFAGQWLYTRAVESHAADPASFPDFDDTLRASMRKETELFFAEFLHGDHELSEMITADFTFADARLAKHYGVTAPGASGFSKITLPANRRGLLGQASVLTVSSYPNRTSPVKRGKWVLGQLLCAAPPPPPPGVEGLKPEASPTGTTRQRMEAHRKNPTCATCHSIMDPIGFGLDSYDGIGAFRTMENGFPLDVSGTLPDGTRFVGAKELGDHLATDARFPRCVTQQLYTYALGRGPESSDDVYLDEIAGRARKMKDIVLEIVLSQPFRERHGEQ